MPQGSHARPIHATTRPAEWFNLGLMRSLGTDLRYHAALPNLLVGAGLLFTFIGLAAALTTASAVVGGPASMQQAVMIAAPPPGATQTPGPLDGAPAAAGSAAASPSAQAADQRNQALKQLLDTASFKFITSLVGLFLSLVYALFRKGRILSVEKALDRFHEALELRVPLLTPADLQQQTNGWLERQHEILQSFSNELAVSIGQSVDHAFDARLGDHVGPLREAIESLATRMSSQNTDAMERMTDAFLQRLQGGTGDQMAGVAATLERLGGKLEGLQSGFGDAAIRMADAADGMARRMGEGADQAMSRVAGQMGDLVATMRDMADRTRGAGEEAGRELSARIAQAAASFEQTSREVAASLAGAGASLQARMDGQAEVAASRLTSQVESMVGELRSLAEASRTTGTETLSALAERLGSAAGALEQTAEKVSAVLQSAAAETGGAFGRGAEDAVNRIAAATEGMRAEMTVLVGELRSAAATAGDTIRAGGAAGADALRHSLGDAGTAVAETLSDAAARLASAGDAAGTALRHGGETAAGRIEVAGGAFGTRAEDLARGVAALTTASDGIVLRIGELDQVVHGAASPLAVAAADLRGTGEAARAAAEPLARLTGALERTAEALSGTVIRLGETGVAAERLMGGLTGAANRFAGVDRELAGTVDKLQAALSVFRGEVTKTVSETDQHLGQAATQLGHLVRDLTNAIEDMGVPGPTNGGPHHPRASSPMGR
jgi:hypothetical protein